MAEDSAHFLTRATERFGVPIVAVGYVLAFAVSVGESVSKLGWRVASGLVCGVCVIWTIYVWRARAPSILDGHRHVPRFGLSLRLGAAAAALVSAIPVTYQVWQSYSGRTLDVAAQTSSRVPPFRIRVNNNMPYSVSLWPYADFYLSEPDTPGNHRIVWTGRMTFQATDGDKLLAVQSGNYKIFNGHFLSETALLPLLARGDLALDVTIRTGEGFVKPHDLTFNKDELTTRWILVTVDPALPDQAAPAVTVK
jgi:hypothetical protein